MKDAVQVGGPHFLPGDGGHGAQEHVLVRSRIIDEHIDAPVPGEDFRKRLLPGLGTRHIERDAEAAVGVLFDQGFRAFAPVMDPQPNQVVG